MSVENALSSIARGLEASAPAVPRPRLGSIDDFSSPSATTIKEQVLNLETPEKQRVLAEFDSAGPIEKILTDPTVIEIMITAKNSIWVESTSGIYQLDDKFHSDLTFNNFVHRIGIEAQIQTNFETPFADGVWRGFRVHLVSPPITSCHTLTFRRLRSNPFTLSQLIESAWCDQKQAEEIRNLVSSRKNIIVVGNTGSGKTTLLSALLKESAADRCILIEDTSELLAPNSLSTKLLTRSGGKGLLNEINQTELVKQSLRMRPDRLIVGEIRGGEAKDLLMALATGHHGSMASLHAGSANEALLRLEMLVQMGAPQWNLDAIRRLIQLTVDRVIVTRKEKTKWHLEGIYKISSQEKFGFIVDRA